MVIVCSNKQCPCESSVEVGIRRVKTDSDLRYPQVCALRKNMQIVYMQHRSLKLTSANVQAHWWLNSNIELMQSPDASAISLQYM